MNDAIKTALATLNSGSGKLTENDVATGMTRLDTLKAYPILADAFLAWTLASLDEASFEKHELAWNEGFFSSGALRAQKGTKATQTGTGKPESNTMLNSVESLAMRFDSALKHFGVEHRDQILSAPDTYSPSFNILDHLTPEFLAEYQRAVKAESGLAPYKALPGIKRFEVSSDYSIVWVWLDSENISEGTGFDMRKLGFVRDGSKPDILEKTQIDDYRTKTTAYSAFRAPVNPAVKKK